MISHRQRIRYRRFCEALRRNSSALAALCFILAVCCAVMAVLPTSIKDIFFSNTAADLSVPEVLTVDYSGSSDSSGIQEQQNLFCSRVDSGSESASKKSSPYDAGINEPSSTMLFVSSVISRLSDTKKKSKSAPVLELVSPDSLEFKNCTSYNIDPAKIISDFGGIILNSDEPQILVIHTHATESYSQSDGLCYTESDPYRTTDNNYNMVRVGNELVSVLGERGIKALHDETLFDYPNYNDSYARSMDAINNWLTQYPSIKIVLDLHRDAIEYSDGSIYRTSADVNDEKCAQILIISGSDDSGLYHPDWRKNLGFGFTLQSRMDQIYPGLTRPLKISQYRYNMQATNGSLIIEVGSHGNTLSEALTAIRYFGNALADVLLYKNGAG